MHDAVGQFDSVESQLQIYSSLLSQAASLLWRYYYFNERKLPFGFGGLVLLQLQLLVISCYLPASVILVITYFIENDSWLFLPLGPLAPNFYLFSATLFFQLDWPEPVSKIDSVFS